MPIYEYRCNGCSDEFEMNRKISDPPLTACPKCGEDKVEKLISRSSFSLKGAGWYSDGYSKGGSAPSCASAGGKPACSGCPGSSSD